MELSIIIVSWNTRDLLCDCLKSVYNQPCRIEFEVIVIDNGSTDGSAEMVETEFPQVNLIKNSNNVGFAAANNQGMAIAKGRYILLLNSDTIVLKNTIAKTIAFANAHPEAAVIGCRVLNQDKSLQPTCFMFPSILNMLLSVIYLYKLLPKSKFFGRERMTWWDRNNVWEVEVVDGCFMLVRREAIEQVGLLDNRFFMYGEETDWCYRFRKAGWKALFTPEAQIVHLGGQSAKQIAPKMTLQLRGGILQFIEKHYSRPVYKVACVLTWLFFALRVPIWLINFAIKRTDYCRIRLTTYLTGMRKLTFQGGKGLCVKTSD